MPYILFALCLLQVLLHTRNDGNAGKTSLEILIGGDLICHRPVLVGGIGRAVKLSRSCEPDEDGFGLDGLPAVQCLIGRAA